MRPPIAAPYLPSDGHVQREESSSSALVGATAREAGTVPSEGLGRDPMTTTLRWTVLAACTVAVALFLVALVATALRT